LWTMIPSASSLTLAEGNLSHVPCICKGGDRSGRVAYRIVALITDRSPASIVKDATRLRRGGDLAGALAVYDALPRELRDHPDVAHARAYVVERMRKRAQKAEPCQQPELPSTQTIEHAIQLRCAGDVRGALALIDGLPSELRRRADIGQQRTDLLDRLCRQVAKKARDLHRNGDWLGALAVYDGLPPDLQECVQICAYRRDFLDRLQTHAHRESRRLRKAGNPGAALAVYDRLRDELCNLPEILQERARLLHRLGELNAAQDMFRKALASDPTQKESWQILGDILVDLGNARELRALIEEMVSALPRSFEALMQAARMAKRGRLHALADKLIDQALSHPIAASATEILAAARTVLDEGDQGRAIDLLKSKTVLLDASVHRLARELSDLAFAQLRQAGRPSSAGPVHPAERADVIAIRSILAQWSDPPEAPPGRGIAIVISSLGAGGAQRQTLAIVRELCRESVGPIFLLLLARSSEHEEFFASRLAGLDVTIEFMSDFDVGVRDGAPQGLADKFAVLPPDIVAHTACLADRLKAHRPEVVLVMSDIDGLPAMLAASVAGVPRVVVSARSGPPSVRGRPDNPLKPAYQAALGGSGISLVTNSSATRRAFADWLKQPVERVGMVYNGIDADGLRRERNPAATAAHRRFLGISDGARIVGSVFQARTPKRPRLWIEAAAAIARRASDVVFVVVGDKHLVNDVSTVLAQNGLDGRFHRPGVRSDVATWLDLMDVVLLVSEAEGTPNVLLEAQALGRPVVATDVGGCAESFLPDETGVLLSADPTPEQVADAVLRVLEDPGFAARALAHGPSFIRRRYDPQRMAREYIDLCFPPSAALAQRAASA
jgi:glycosyltransferase involved in cell wall biosynthesis/tetratricopeptide (TPR) repeat protein